MKILKHGDSAVIRELNNFVQFHCPTCHCIFEAANSEYTRHFHYDLNNVVDCGSYVTICPDCRKPVIKEIPDEEVQVYDCERTQGNS